MYFIQEGIVDIIKSNNEVMTTLSDGSYFGGFFKKSFYIIQNGIYRNLLIIKKYAY